MKREADLKRRLQGLHALHDAVSAMKSLSAHYVQEARAAVEPARAYQQGVTRILEHARIAWPAGTGGVGLVVIGAELGLCGTYNAQVVRAAVERRAALGAGPTLCVGHRAATLLGRHGVAIAARYPGPTGVRGINDVLLRLAEDLLTRYVRQRLRALEIVSSRFAGVGVARPESVRLLPLPAAASAEPWQLRYVSPSHFASALLREFLFITLYDLLLDALACEHSARLIATQSAEQWLEERSADLQRHLSAARREASTQEVIEIAAGARVRNPMR